METRTAMLAVALAVAAVAAVPAAGLAATGGPVMADHQDNSTAGNASVAPGARLSGVVGVQEAELSGDVDERAFGIAVADAASEDARAGVVAAQLEDTEERLATLERRKGELDEARENGSISEGRYRAEVARVAAETETAEDLADRSANATRGLPAALLESKGINVTAIQTLKERAEALTGPEVAEIARSIAGDASPVERGPDERPGRAGGPDDDSSEDAGPDEQPGDAGPDERPGDGGPDAGDGSGGGDAAEDTPTPTDDDGDRVDSDDAGNGSGDSGNGGNSGDSDGSNAGESNGDSDNGGY